MHMSSKKKTVRKKRGIRGKKWIKMVEFQSVRLSRKSTCTISSHCQLRSTNQIFLASRFTQMRQFCMTTNFDDSKHPQYAHYHVHILADECTCPHTRQICHNRGIPEIYPPIAKIIFLGDDGQNNFIVVTSYASSYT